MCDQQSLRSACADAQSDHSLCMSLGYSISVKLLTEQHLGFLILKVSCTGLSESTLVKIPHCLKSYVTAQIKSTDKNTNALCLNNATCNQYPVPDGNV